jgi:hypothetical protein
MENTRRTVRSVHADCPRRGRGLSARRARTVATEPLVVNREQRTVRDGPADRPTPHGPFGTLVRTVRKLHAPKIHRQKDQKKGTVRHLVDNPR